MEKDDYYKLARNQIPGKKGPVTEQEFKEWWICKRKVKYFTRDEAKDSVKRLNQKFKSKNKVYRCEFCKNFHAGTLHEDKKKRKDGIQ